MRLVDVMHVPLSLHVPLGAQEPLNLQTSFEALLAGCSMSINLFQ